MNLTSRKVQPAGPSLRSRYDALIRRYGALPLPIATKSWRGINMGQRLLRLHRDLDKNVSPALIGTEILSLEQSMGVLEAAAKVWKEEKL